MSMHVHNEVSESDVPLEFMKQAFSHLEASEKLNALMCDDVWPSNYYRGQAVLWLAFHAVELFLKGCILKLDPSANIKSHSLSTLTKKLKTLNPGIDFEPPFGVEPLPPYPGLIERAEKTERKIHEALRYPIDTERKPWPGVRGYSAPLFQGTLARTRNDCERLYDQIFKGSDG